MNHLPVDEHCALEGASGTSFVAARFARRRAGAGTLLIGIAVGLLLVPQRTEGAWRNFSDGDGLIHNRVRDIVEDDDGNLWFATSQGLSRFDGVTWTSFTTAQGLRSNNLTCAFKDRDGDLWFGSTGGVARFSGGSLHTYRSAPDTLSSNTIHGITQDQLGRMWFATSNGVTILAGNAWGRWATWNSGLASNTVLCVFEDSSGNMWFGYSDYGVSRFGGGVWELFGTADGLAGNSVRQVFEDDHKNLWFATDAGVSRRDSSGTWSTFRSEDGLGGDDVHAIGLDVFGNVWAGTWSEGVNRYDGRAWESFHSFDGLRVYAIRRDRSGNLWFANTGGATRYDGVAMEAFLDVPGLATLTFRSVTEDRAGSIWFGSPEGAWCFDGATWARKLPEAWVSAVTEDHEGHYWFTIFGDGLMRWDGDTTWVSFTRATHGLATDSTIWVYEDPSHDLWVTGIGGISHSSDRGDTWEVFTMENTSGGLGSNNVYWALQDRVGRMWFATWGGGVSSYDSLSGWRRYTTSDGLGAHRVWSVFEDGDGYLWFGTYENGASRFDGASSWRQFTSADGLGNDYPLTFMQDRAGALWFTMDLGGGVTRWDGTEWRSLGLSDGLPSSSVACALEDRTGNVWLGTFRGVARYTPDRIPPRTVVASAPPAISPSPQQAAVFDVLGETDRIEYSYRIDGGPWSTWSALNAWSDQNVTDGVHTLEVRARDYWANVDPTPEAVTFEIDAMPPQPLIAAPAFGAPVRGTEVIRGDATDARFERYQVMVRREGSAAWTPPQATVLAESTIPVDDGDLASWDTSGFPDGNYELRLSVIDSLGLTGTAQVTVVVDNEAPFFEVTTPVLVTAGLGGDIYTGGGELHLYVPPNAFERDALVSIVTAQEAAPPLAGAQPLGLAYELTWEGVSLSKPATLEYSLAGVDLSGSGGVAAVYHSMDGAEWLRLGGTVQQGRISLPITGLGRYALYGDGGGGEGGKTLGELSFTPRVFSPSGSFGKRDVAIGFTLGRTAPVTVKVYNRAGRLVREVAAGLTFGTGANLVRWDGRDRNGAVVSEGLYVVTVEALGEKKQRSLAVVR